MFQEKKPNNFLMQQEQGLGRFSFGGFAKSLVKGIGRVVRQAVPILGDMICDAIDENLNDGWNLKTGDIYEPTNVEQNLIDSWAETKLNPFCVKLTKELDVALKALTLAEQITKINKVLSKICFTQAYFRTNYTNGLSADAVLWRNDYIKTIFAPFIDIVETTLASKPVANKQMANVASNITSLDLSPFVSITTVPSNYTCNHYKVKEGVIMEPMIPAMTDPVSGAPVIVPIKETPASSTTTTEKNFLQKNAIPLALGAVALWALLSGKKKSKK